MLNTITRLILQKSIKKLHTMHARLTVRHAFFYDFSPANAFFFHLTSLYKVWRNGRENVFQTL